MLQRKDAISSVSDTVYKTFKDFFLHEANIKIILINDVIAPPHCKEKYVFFQYCIQHCMNDISETRKGLTLLTSTCSSNAIEIFPKFLAGDNSS